MEAMASRPAPRRGAPATPSRDAAPTPSLTPWTRSALQELLWSHVGLLRTGDQLDAAAAQLAAWHRPDLAALATVGELKDRNLLDLARLLATRALARTTSVGAHHRLDDPTPVLHPAQEALAC